MSSNATSAVVSYLPSCSDLSTSDLSVSDAQAYQPTSWDYYKVPCASHRILKLTTPADHLPLLLIAVNLSHHHTRGCLWHLGCPWIYLLPDMGFHPRMPTHQRRTPPRALAVLNSCRPQWSRGPLLLPVALCTQQWGLQVKKEEIQVAQLQCLPPIQAGTRIFGTHCHRGEHLGAG